MTPHPRQYVAEISQHLVSQILLGGRNLLNSKLHIRICQAVDYVFGDRSVLLHQYVHGTLAF